MKKKVFLIFGVIVCLIIGSLLLIKNKPEHLRESVGKKKREPPQITSQEKTPHVDRTTGEKPQEADQVEEQDTKPQKKKREKHHPIVHRPNAYVILKVIDPAYKPIKNAIILIRYVRETRFVIGNFAAGGSSGGRLCGLCKSIHTDENGVAKVPVRFEDGEKVRLIIYADGFAFEEMDLELSEGETREVTLQMEPGGIIRGKIVGLSPKIIKELSVTLSWERKGKKIKSNLDDYINDDGTFGLEELPLTNFILKIRDPVGRFLDYEQNVFPDGREIIITLTPNPNFNKSCVKIIPVGLPEIPSNGVECRLKYRYEDESIGIPFWLYPQIEKIEPLWLKPGVYDFYFITDEIGDTRYFSQIKSFHIPVGQTLELQVAFQKGFSIEGIVLDAVTREPISDVNIDVEVPVTSAYYYIEDRYLHGRTDKNGKFRISGFAEPGIKVLEFWGFFKERYKERYKEKYIKEVMVSPGMSPIEILLEPKTD